MAYPKGKPRSEGTKAKIRAALKGKPLSAKTRKKMSIAAKQRWAKYRQEKEQVDETTTSN